jgi:cytochrome c biogenesis protein CcdA
MLNLLLALLAGIVTIAAPCTLPVLPILLGASIGQRSKTRPAFIAFGFVTAFTLVALLVGWLTRAFDFDPNVLRDGAAVALIIFGILMIWPAPFEWLTMQLPVFSSGHAGTQTYQGNWGGFVLGTTLGLVWTPCAGPVLGSILTVIATAGSLSWSGVLLLAYAVGAAIPMLAIAYGGQVMTTRVRSVARIAPRLQQAFGAVIIAFAIATYFQYDTDLVAWLTGFYPSGTNGL